MNASENKYLIQKHFNQQEEEEEEAMKKIESFEISNLSFLRMQTENKQIIYQLPQK